MLGDLHLIHADQRPEEGDRGSLVHNGNIAGGLRGDLAQTVACCQRPALVGPSNLLGDPHHHAAVQHDPQRRRRRHHDLPLNVAERDQIQTRIVLVAGQALSQFFRFFG